MSITKNMAASSLFLAAILAAGAATATYAWWMDDTRSENLTDDGCYLHWNQHTYVTVASRDIRCKVLSSGRNSREGAWAVMQTTELRSRVWWASLPIDDSIEGSGQAAYRVRVSTPVEQGTLISWPPERPGLSGAVTVTVADEQSPEPYWIRLDKEPANAAYDAVRVDVPQMPIIYLSALRRMGRSSAAIRMLHSVPLAEEAYSSPPQWKKRLALEVQALSGMKLSVQDRKALRRFIVDSRDRGHWSDVAKHYGDL